MKSKEIADSTAQLGTTKGEYAMPLKKLINKYVYTIAGSVVVLMTIVIAFVQVLNEQNTTYEMCTKTFLQFEQILSRNQQELEQTEKEYAQTCITNAKIVSRILENAPELIGDLEELRVIAELVGVDEIHIFDKNGKLYSGTNPEYYNMTFNSGEQMQFFLPMLKDKSLELVQEITPNTAISKMMQYSAVWNKGGEFIVQVGNEPVHVLEVREKNTLSYIFNFMKVNPEADYYAVDPKTGEILGSTQLDFVGKDVEDIGFDFNTIKEDDDGFHETINGKYSFCVFGKVGDIYIGSLVLCSSVYQRIPSSIAVLFGCLVVIAFVLARTVISLTNKLVIKEIYDVNEKLEEITEGNYNTMALDSRSTEFLEITGYINRMIKNLSDNNKRMAYVLGKTNLYIGTYAYSSKGSGVHMTEHVPVILSASEEDVNKWTLDKEKFIECINEIKRVATPDEPGVYRKDDKFVRIEEISDEKEVFGVIIDVTNDILKRREIENQRDMDLLTGLYNRRGLDLQLTRLFSQPERMGHYAMIMIDADGLKGINDIYGHEKGDIYLRKIGKIINHFGMQGSVASRQGGDEYVLFLYDYNDEDELMETIHTLERIQNNSTVRLDDDLIIPVRFSLGYSIGKGANDYQAMLKDADEKMYRNKLDRRGKATR